MITVNTQPADLAAGYSALPLRVLSDLTDVENLRYVVNILYDGVGCDTLTAVSVGAQVYSKASCSASHNYEVGDVILFDNDVSNSYTGIYKIIAVTSATDFIFDLVITTPPTLTVAQFYRIVPYSILPDEDYEAKLYLNNTIKDFVTQNLEDTPEIYEAPDTVFEYDILIGEEYKYVFDFTDNIFVSGDVGFINPSLTPADVDASPIQVGDQINIQQEQFEWSYDDNYDASGSLGFTSTDDHPFEVGDLIVVTGQSTHPSYNGAVEVIDVPSSSSLVVNKSFISATGTEGGSIFGQPVPEYNTIATVTAIYHDVTNGYVIETNLGFAQSTPPIGGRITFADGRRTSFLDQETITNLKAYNSRLTNQEYGFSNGDFSNYVIEAGAAIADNKISTILAKNNTRRHRIELDSKFWLLVHGDKIGAENKLNILLTAYDSSDTIVIGAVINNFKGFNDYYFPGGLSQLALNSDKTINIGDFTQPTLDSVSYYKLEILDNFFVTSDTVFFEINPDCSSYDVYHICWKDSYGSWITYPFIYFSEDSTEFEKKNYYQIEGSYNQGDFGYETFGRGEVTFYSRSRDKLILNSGWIKEEENELFKDMLESPYVMVQHPDGTMEAVQVMDKAKDFKKLQQDYLFMHTIELRMSNNNYRF